MTQAPGTTAAPPNVDWQRAPYIGAVQWIALALTILGVFGLAIGLAGAAFAGVALTIAGAVLLSAGGVCWSLYAVAYWWRHESRNQMLTVCAAIVRQDQVP